MEREIRLAPAPFDAIEELVKRHHASLPGPVDSYAEAHLLASAHYRIEVGGRAAGCASIHQERMITQFILDEPFRYAGQRVFWEVRRLEHARAAFVSTSDQFFLAHALADHRRLAVQAFLFADAQDRAPAPAVGYALRPAHENDVELIGGQAGAFFDRLAERIAAGELFVTMRQDEPVGFGLVERSALLADVASIGMFAIERHRRSGVGTATIALLIQECRRRGVRPVAGCWFYNHASKRTRDRAGMHAPARLLKIEY